MWNCVLTLYLFLYLPLKNHLKTWFVRNNRHIMPSQAPNASWYLWFIQQMAWGVPLFHHRGWGKESLFHPAREVGVPLFVSPSPIYAITQNSKKFVSTTQVPPSVHRTAGPITLGITRWMKSMYFCFFRGNQKILTGLYNGSLTDNIFWSINK